MASKKPTRATVMMCINCGSTRIEVDERFWGNIYECQSCGHEDTKVGWGYYAADVKQVTPPTVLVYNLDAQWPIKVYAEEYPGHIDPEFKRYEVLGAPSLKQETPLLTEVWVYIEGAKVTVYTECQLSERDCARILRLPVQSASPISVNAKDEDARRF